MEGKRKIRRGKIIQERKGWKGESWKSGRMSEYNKREEEEGSEEKGIKRGKRVKEEGCERT